ncbi:MAG: hypothetical protein U1F11_05965 [Steroidobacteraceae bacterium]
MNIAPSAARSASARLPPSFCRRLAAMRSASSSRARASMRHRPRRLHGAVAGDELQAPLVRRPAARRKPLAALNGSSAGSTENGSDSSVTEGSIAACNSLPCPGCGAMNTKPSCTGSSSVSGRRRPPARRARDALLRRQRCLLARIVGEHRGAARVAEQHDALEAQLAQPAHARRDVVHRELVLEAQVVALPRAAKPSRTRYGTVLRGRRLADRQMNTAVRSPPRSVQHADHLGAVGGGGQVHGGAHVGRQQGGIPGSAAQAGGHARFSAAAPRGLGLVHGDSGQGAAGRPRAGRLP